MYFRNQTDVSDLADELSDARKLVALKRAAKAFDIHIGTDGEVDKATAEFFQTDEFCEQFGLQLKMMVVADMIAQMAREGQLEVDSVDPDTGEALYKAGPNFNV